MLELKNVSKYYNSNGTITVALRNINLKLSKGEIVAITGESGAGKSTLLNVICGVDTYEDGEIYFKGQETSYFNQNDMDVFRKNHIGFIYQAYNIIDSYTVLENVMLPLILKGETKEKAKEKALIYIEKVGLSHRINNKGIKLSGGEKQRCVIARALAQDFEILACDEPTGNLDSETGRQIIELIKEVAQDKLVLIVTHNYEQVKDIVTRTIKVSDAEIVEDKFNEVVDDNLNEELTLIESKNKVKSLLTVAYMNVKNTPKKTFFTSIVFMVFSFVLLFLLLTMVAWNDINKYTPNDQYYNTIHERIVVYNKDYSPIDLNDFKDFDEEIYTNTFYEDIKFSFRGYYLDSYSKVNVGSTLVGSFTNHVPYEYVNVIGNMAINENEAYIIFPINLIEEYSDEYVRYVNEKIDIAEYRLKSLDLTLSGFGYSSTVSNITLVTKANVSDLFFRLYLVDLNVMAYANNEEIEVGYSISGNIKKPLLTYFYKEELDFDNLNIILKDIYHISLDDYDINFIESDIFENFLLEIPMDFNFDEIFELSIYSDDFNETIKDITKLGYAYRLPGKNGVIIDSQESLYFMLFVVIAVIAIIILFFITYVIVSKISSSKLKDYTILRSNGVLRGSMKNIVHFEIISIGFLSSIISIIVFLVLSLFIPTLKDIGYYNSFIIMMGYLLLNLIFDYFISRRLNNKIFKNTVAGSFKSEVINNG